MFNGSWGIYGFENDTNEHPQSYTVNEENWNSLTSFQVIKILCKTWNNMIKTHKIHDMNPRYKKKVVADFLLKDQNIT